MNWNLKARMVEVYGGQWRFAAALNEHEAVVSRVVRGKIQLDPERQRKWALALGVSDVETIFPKVDNDREEANHV